MMRFFITGCILLVALTLHGQYVSTVTKPDTTIKIIEDTSMASVKYALQIKTADLQKHLTILASDSLEGRETGTPGNDMAAEYIANHFKALGLQATGEEGGYFQRVVFNRTGWAHCSITVNDNTYKHLWDFLAFPTMNDHMPDVKTDNVVFLGYGIDDPAYSDYKNRDVRGKVIMINKGEPMKRDSTYWISGTKQSTEWSKNIWKKLGVARENGVKMVFIIENDLKSFLDKNRRFLVSPSLRLGSGEGDRSIASHAYISPGIAKDIIGSHDKKIKRWRKKNVKRAKTRDISMDTRLAMRMDKSIELITGKNVLGYIEGTDKKDELVVVSAHFDHLGKRGKDIFNGADDNGSGTSAVLEIAESLALARKDGKGPRRSVLCLLVTGEEKGLLGSEYYSENPVFPLEATVADVNVDMIGRVDKKHAGDPHYIYVIGSDRLSSELHAINERANQDFAQLTLDYTYNSEEDPNRYYYRSDHYNFARKGIPSIFYFSGVHEDYHRPGDTVDKIMFGKMEKVARLIFHTTWELANRSDRIVVDRDVQKP